MYINFVDFSSAYCDTNHLLNYAIIQDIPFDVGQVIKDSILHNWDAKMNLGHPFLIYGLCKRAGVPLDDNEAWLHPIKAISVKREKRGVPQPEEAYDSGHEPSEEDELHNYQDRFGLLVHPWGDLRQSSTHPPLPLPQPTSEVAPSSRTPDLEDLMLALTDLFDALRDETQEHRVLITQDMEALRADVRTILANKATILQQQQSSRPSLPSFQHSTSRHRHHHSDPFVHQGSSLHPLLFFYWQWGHWIFLFGGVWVVIE